MQYVQEKLALFDNVSIHGYDDSHEHLLGKKVGPGHVSADQWPESLLT